MPSLTVTDLTGDALAPPTGFTEVWNDRGSDADDDVRVLRMNPPAGYTCLGYVAARGYGTTPNANQYRYVLLLTWRACMTLHDRALRRQKIRSKWDLFSTYNIIL